MGAFDEEPEGEADLGDEPDDPHRVADRAVVRGDQGLEEPDEDRDAVEEKEPTEHSGEEPAARHEPPEGEESGREEHLSGDEAHLVGGQRQRRESWSWAPVRPCDSQSGVVLL